MACLDLKISFGCYTMAIITALFCKLRHDHAYDILVFIGAKL
jgi:hypothetical protein